jgi:hypothetical protein
LLLATSDMISFMDSTKIWAITKINITNRCLNIINNMAHNNKDKQDKKTKIGSQKYFYLL